MEGISMKPQEINPQETTRAEAFELWMVHMPDFF